MIGALGIGYLVSTGALVGAPDWYVILLAVSTIVICVALSNFGKMR